MIYRNLPSSHPALSRHRWTLLPVMVQTFHVYAVGGKVLLSPAAWGLSSPLKLRRARPGGDVIGTGSGNFRNGGNSGARSSATRKHREVPVHRKAVAAGQSDRLRIWRFGATNWTRGPAETIFFPGSSAPNATTGCRRVLARVHRRKTPTQRPKKRRSTGAWKACLREGVEKLAATTTGAAI